MTTAAPAPNDVLEKVDTLGPPGTPVTTPEVADGFDCTQRTIYNRLETLVEEETLLTKKVGANSRVWWRPVEDPSRGSETHQATEQIRSHPVFDSELVGVVVWREDLTIGDANDAFLEMSGLGYENAVGTSWRELTPAEFHSVSDRQIDQFEETGSVTYEKQYYHADGSRWWGVFESRALNDAKFVEFVVDITERKEATRELRETNEQLTVALEAGGMGTWEWDLDARAGTGDEQFMRLWDLPGSDGPIPVEEFLSRMDPESAADSEAVMDTAFDPGEEIQEEVRLDDVPDAPRWISWRARATEEDPSTLVGVSFDSTERKETEKALRETKTRLEDELAGMRRLHDLRATLATETDLHAAFGEIIEAANDVLDTDRGCIQLVSDDGERLEMAEYRGYDGQSPFLQHFLHEGSKPACDAARQNRERLVIEDVETFPGLLGTTDREVALEDGIRATQSTPMIARNGELIGVLSNQFREPHRPSDRELRLIDMLAWTAAEFFERHRAQEELRESEERFRTLFDSVSESMSEAFCVIEMMLDVEGMASATGANGSGDTAARDEPTDYRFVETNAAFEALIGLTDVVGERRCELELAGDPPGFEACDDVLRTGESKRIETNDPHYDGWYDVRVFPYGGADSGTVAVLIDDITERKEMEADLRESEARLSKILEQLPVGVGVLDADGNFEMQYDLLEELTGGRMPSIDPEQRDHWNAWDDDGDPLPAEQWPGARALRGEEVTPGVEFRFELNGMTRWINVATVPFEEVEEPNGALVVLHDITERKQAKEKLAIELEAIKRLQEVSTQPVQPGDGDTLYDAVLDTAVDMLDAEFGSLQRLDSEAKELELLTHRGFNEEARSAWAQVTLDHASTCGRALQTGGRVVVSDVEASEFMRGTADQETYLQTGIRAVQTTPLVSRDGSVIGMLSTHWAEPHEPSERDLHLLDVLARQVADLMEQRAAYEALRESEASLQRLNDATRELINAETGTIADRVAPLVREVLDVEYAALWRYDDQSGDLEERTVDAAPDLDSNAEFSTEMADRAWETFVGADLDVVNNPDASADVSSPVRSRAFVPLGRHGIVCLGSTEADTFDERTVDLVETVAATVETAWDRAESEEALARQNEELTRLDRLNTLIRSLDQALVGAGSRDAIEESVCERLASSKLYGSAWLATYDAETDTLRPQAWAGVDSGYLEDRTVTLSEASDDDPLVAAHRSRERQVVSDIAVDARAAPWREDALERGARSCLTIPLVYGESLYGVLTVYGRAPQPDERETDVLAELGETIAHAIHALEATTTRRTDSVVELTLRAREATTPLARLAREADCDMTVEGLVPSATDDALTVFFTATGVSPDDLATAGAEVLAIDDLVCLDERDGGALYRAHLTDPHLCSLLGTREAVVRSVAIDGGIITLVVDLPETGVVSEVLDDLRGRLPDVELLARTTRTRPLQTQYSLRMALEDRLTARQLEVLRMAYESGFFESPRVQTGTDLSEALDVSQSTFTYHLRESQRRLCEMVFEPA